MSHPFDILPLENGAKVIFTPCPGTKGASLEASVMTLKDAHATSIVSAMFDEEMQNLNAEALPQVCQDNEISWYQLPLGDDMGPDEHFFQAWQLHKDSLISRLRNQEILAVHCKGGSGRTGLLISLLLIELGYSKPEVKSLVQSMRPHALTKPEQLNFFENY